jgi:hypothetical protein
MSPHQHCQEGLMEACIRDEELSEDRVYPLVKDLSNLFLYIISNSFNLSILTLIFLFF